MLANVGDVDAIIDELLVWIDANQTHLSERVAR